MAEQRRERSWAEREFPAPRKTHERALLLRAFLDNVTRDTSAQDRVKGLRIRHQHVTAAGLTWLDLQDAARSPVAALHRQYESGKQLAERFGPQVAEGVAAFPNPWDGVTQEEVDACRQDVEQAAKDLGLHATWGPQAVFFAMKTGYFGGVPTAWRSGPFQVGRGRPARNLQEHGYWLCLHAVGRLSYKRIADRIEQETGRPIEERSVRRETQRAARLIGLELAPLRGQVASDSHPSSR